MSGSNEMLLGEGALKQIATEVTTGRDAFQALARTLSSKITEKTPQWQGAGGASFFNLHNAWHDKHTKIVNALNEFEASLHQTDRDATNTDHNQSQAMGTNLSALDAVPANY